MSAWGIQPQERLISFPCDKYLPDFEAAYFRGVTVNSPADIVFRWLCQMKIAPYSYDWIDNRGRQSPRTLTPGLDRLDVGQKIMGAPLVEFEPNKHLTAGGESKTLGKIYVTYLIVPQEHNECRLLVKVLARYPRSITGLLLHAFLPWGDLIMMRRQLLNFKTLSEQTYEQNFQKPPAEQSRSPPRASSTR